MDIGNLFKIDYWWKLVLLGGILLSASSMMFDIQFIERRYVLGLGLGMFLIGLGVWMAKKVMHQKDFGGYYYWEIFEHNWVTKLIIGSGIVISIYFLIRILIILMI